MPKKPHPAKSQPTTSFPSLSREALEEILSDLYEKFDTVRDFIDLKITGNSDPLLKKYKKLIKNRLIEDLEDGTNGLFDALEAVREFALFNPAPRERSETVVQDSADFGYGFHDSLGDSFSIYYDKEKSKKIPVVRKPVAVKKIKKAMPKKAGS